MQTKWRRTTILVSSDRGPVQEGDDPVTVVREAWRAFLADAGHTCHGELTNNSGPGSVETSLIEARGQDRIHMVVHGHGGPAGVQKSSLSGTTNTADSALDLGRNMRTTSPGDTFRQAF